MTFNFPLNQLITIKSPIGLISEVGIQAITQYWQNQKMSDLVWVEANPDYNPKVSGFYLPALPAAWDYSWIVAKGKYAGTFPKRAGKFLHQKDIKAPESFLSELGNIARAHAETSHEYTFEFVDKFDWQAGDFGDAGSCYWGSCSEARELLQDAGGLAVRFYKDSGSYARAWLFPYSPDFSIVFNGYGLTTLTIARLMALYFGVSYKKISLTNWSEDGGTLYINAGNGFVIGANDAIVNVSKIDLELGEGYTSHCSNCGCGLYEDDEYITENDVYCSDCYHDLYTSCDHCGNDVYREDIYYTADEHDVCENCLDRHYTACDECGEYYPNESITVIEDVCYCEHCKPAETENEE